MFYNYDDEQERFLEHLEQNECLSETCDLAYTDHSDDECNSAEDCEQIYAELFATSNLPEKA